MVNEFKYQKDDEYREWDRIPQHRHSLTIVGISPSDFEDIVFRYWGILPSDAGESIIRF